MNNEHIKGVFKTYLETPNTQYALLLNGAWGSGKTFFWKNVLSEVATKNNYKPIYITLNGVNTIEALEQRFFIACLSENNKLAKAAIDFFSFVGKKAINTNYADIAKSIENYSTYIVCFDDLERCQIPIKVVMGFINDFVEHKKLKVIIFADATKNALLEEEYKEIKEKMIGRELLFELNMAETLPLIFEKYKDSEDSFCAFLVQYQAYILQLFLEYEVKNLRTISFYLDTLKKLFPAFKDIERQYIEEILFFSAIITIEFKTGKLQSSDADNPKDIDEIDRSYWIKLLPENDRVDKALGRNTVNRDYSKEFYEKYVKSKIEKYAYYPSIYCYVLSGHLKINELKQEIQNRISTVMPPEIVKLYQLKAEFRKLDNEVLDEIAEAVLEYAKNGKYQIYEYIDIAFFFYIFSENKIINKSISEVNKVIIDGLEISKLHSKLSENTLDMMHSIYQGEQYYHVISLIYDAHEQIKNNQNTKTINEFINCITSSDEETMTNLFNNGNLSGIFEKIDTENLFNAIIRMKNEQITNFSFLLRDRYRPQNAGESYSSDYTCMGVLKRKVEDYLAINVSLHPHKRFLLTELHTELTEICRKLAPKIPTT